MVATDGHRLCYFRMGVATNGAEGANSIQCLIPIKAVRELLKILADEIRAGGKAEVKIRKGSELEFEIGTAREITGAFPNWEMVLPKSFDYFAELNVKEFRDALTRVGVMADDSHRRVEFVFHYDKVLLKTESPESGSSAEEVSCTFQKFSGSEFQNETVDHSIEDGWKIAFNAKYLNDFFTNQAARRDEQKVIWKFTSDSSQTEISLEGEEKLFSYILVPLKS